MNGRVILGFKLVSGISLYLVLPSLSTLNFVCKLLYPEYNISALHQYEKLKPIQNDKCMVLLQLNRLGNLETCGQAKRQGPVFNLVVGHNVSRALTDAHVPKPKSRGATPQATLHSPQGNHRRLLYRTLQ